jgi:hypothetical protein
VLRGGPSQSSTIETSQSEPMMRRGRGLVSRRGLSKAISSPRHGSSSVRVLAPGLSCSASETRRRDCAEAQRCPAIDVRLQLDDARWADTEGVSETVIAAVLLLHERGVDEIAFKLSTAELEQLIELVGRSPGVYPPGTLDVLKQRRALVSPEPPRQSGESTRSDVAAEKQHAGRPVLTRGGRPALIPGAIRRCAHLRDLTPAPMIGAKPSER